MKRYALLSVIVLLSMLLALVTVPTAAQQPTPRGGAVTPSAQALAEPMTLPPLPQRAEQPASESTPVAAPEQGTWHLLSAAPFQYTRFDGVFVPGEEPWGNRIYFPGGRDNSSTESPNIWMFDPATLTWSDTGYDVIEDVSNYTANLVMDDGTGRGPAIYIIGGYNADGAPAGNIGTVQRFYPQVGVVEALPPADNWTPTVAGSLVGAMGTAVVDNIIYVFGGWENLAAPYTYAGTWAFDPSQPSGSRWTDLGITINPGRAYIQVAVQNDVIYAMGGTVYDGSNLTPLTTVEALDTNNIAAGWQARSPMPVASGEGRGFGFDADTLTEAPIPWDGHIYLAGGGAWPNSSAEAMEYLTGPDSWNQDFANLNQARRDHAGVFVPLCTENPNDGLPGLWVFGGRMTADTPPYADPEYYPLPCAATCNVLVVDDDWDFDQTVPNDGGRPYYTSALDELGYDYTVWDTVNQGDPTTADMSPYDIVIWFTGYAYEDGVFTPANETQVAAYLDGGGNFILSSQEYHYEAGAITPFMANYLGVANMSNDEIELDPVGNTGNPIGNGLGPYAMTRPDDWAAYWPTGSYQGPYDDYANALPGADEPFRFNASGENNSTSYDTGIFKTAFLAWPFEWIDTVEERAEILGQALSWMCVPAGEPQMYLIPPYQEGHADPNTSVTYDVTLTNLLGADDTFDLEYSSVWPANGPVTITVGNGASVQFQVQITVPPDADCLAEDTAVVTAHDSTHTYSDTAEMRTIAGPDWEVESNSGASGTHWVAFACTDDYGADGTCFYAGGLGAGNTVTGVAQRYDIATGAWTALPSLPTPVFGAVGGFVGGHFCVAGGYTTTSGDWGGTYALQCYNPATNAWAAGPDIPGPVEIGGAGGAAGGVEDGILHVTGGCGANTCSSNQHFGFDGTSWTPLAVLPDFLVFHGAAAGEGRLYIGGDYGGGTGFYEYNPSTDTWTPRASLPTSAGQKSPVGVVVPGGGVFWWGGDLGAWSGVQNTTWYWDPVVNGWTQFTAQLNQATTGAGGGLADGRLWNFGGSTGAGPLSPPPHESLTYCIPPSPGAGSLIGHVYDANTGDPIVNANVYVEGISVPSFWEERRSGPDGGYAFDPIIANDYWLHVMGMDYFDHYYIGPITITEGEETVMDVYLDASWPELSDSAVSVTAPAGGHVVYTMGLHNAGTGDLHFHVSEVPDDGIYPPNATMPRGVDAQVYRDLAASTDGTTRFIAYMAEQADLSAAFGMDWTARGRYVLETLRSTARRTQAGLLADLTRAGVSYESRYIVNAVVVTGGRAVVDSIAARPEVAFIGPDTTYAAPSPVESAPAPESGDAVEWGVHRIRADEVWSTFGVTGAGIVVSNIDTGVQYDHPALVNQYRGNLGGSSYDHNYNWWDPYGDQPLAPYDYGGHGSHTMGTMVGDDGGSNQIGVAPGAQWMACNGFDQGGSGYDAELLECAEFVLAPWDLTGANPDPDMRPDVVNNSWGGGPAQWWYMQAIYAWRAAGIFPSFSGGNSGPGCGTVHSPSDTYNILSSGATDSSDAIAGFSSRGPADITGITKPNVAAPGASIRSSIPGNSYALFSGTSMASPHTAGEAALIWSAVPELRGNVQQTYWVIEQSAKPITTTQGCGGDTPSTIPNNVYGWGRIDAYEAVNMALNANWDIPWLSVDPTQGVVEPDGSADIELTFDGSELLPGECYTGMLKFEYNDPYIHEEFIPVQVCVAGNYIYLPIIARNH